MPMAEGFQRLFRSATTRIIILGTNPLHPLLEQNAQFFADLLTLNRELTLTILSESDSENFSQSLILDRRAARNRTSYASLSAHRDRILGRRAKEDGLFGEIDRLNPIDMAEKPQVLARITVSQINLRIPVNLILSDEQLWCTITCADLPTLDDYFLVPDDAPYRGSLLDLLTYYSTSDDGRKFHSSPGDELIQLYDRQGIPRGIFPRQCFYTTDYQRYSIWGLVFNRSGQLLLHQRSALAKDGPSLWDKSVGGHVDLKDSSTYITAQRELVEEMFLPEAEFSRYIRADLGDILHFGDWNPLKRPERTFREAFANLGRADWVMYRATDSAGDPLTIARKSDRLIRKSDGQHGFAPTVFRSDLYFFVSPPDLLDTDDQMKALLALPEQSGAAQDHKLVHLHELQDWIESEEASSQARFVFTDDLLYLNQNYRDLLASFAEFVRYIASSLGQTQNPAGTRTAP